MTVVSFSPSQVALDELVRQEARLAKKLGLGNESKQVQTAGSVLKEAISKGLILFIWECPERGECGD